MSDTAFKLDLSRFTQAVTYVHRNTEKTLPDILNRAALVCIIGGRGVSGAMKLTPKADPGKINAVPVKSIAKVVMARARANGTKPTRRQVALLIGKEYKRRIAARGYTAFVGWNKAAIAFGGRGVGRRAAGQGYASKGYGTRATFQKLIAEFVNTAPAAELIGREALQSAVNETATDMIEHVQQKMQALFNEVSAR